MANLAGSSQCAPSQFAKILHRSKFSSYDPHIGQVYVSHGGYQYRGDYGLKRPLPISARHRNSVVRVKQVDGRYKQTEWVPAKRQANFIKSFDETGAGVSAAEISLGLGETLWRHRLHQKGSATDFTRAWEVDSPFDLSKASHGLVTRTPPMQPNVDSMTFKEFEGHVASLYKEHSEMLLYSTAGDIAYRKSRGLPSINAVESMRVSPEYYSGFVRKKAIDRKDMQLTEELSPYPHPNAGLSYSVPNSLQEAIRYPSTRGRLMRNAPAAASADPTRAYDQSSVVAVGGVVGRLPNNAVRADLTNHLDVVAVRSGLQSPESGEADVKVIAASLYKAPRVVGKSNRSNEVVIDVTASEAKQMTNYTRNPLGTMEYCYGPSSPKSSKNGAVVYGTTAGNQLTRAGKKYLEEQRQAAKDAHANYTTSLIRDLSNGLSPDPEMGEDSSK